VLKKIIQANEAIVSTQVINEICVNLLKKTELSEQDIRALILSFYGSYRVIELNPDILLKASELRDQYSFSFWDSMIVASALYAQCEILYSEDMQSGLQVEEKLIVQNPFKTL
jgi:predicted nucleic acid-binding protein